MGLLPQLQLVSRTWSVPAMLRALHSAAVIVHHDPPDALAISVLLEYTVSKVTISPIINNIMSQRYLVFRTLTVLW